MADMLKEQVAEAVDALAKLDFSDDASRAPPVTGILPGQEEAKFKSRA